MLDKMSKLGVVLNKESQKSINGGDRGTCLRFCAGVCVFNLCYEYEK